MLNWMCNTLTISNEYRSKILDYNNKVDFNIVVPMPMSNYGDYGYSTWYLWCLKN